MLNEMRAASQGGGLLAGAQRNAERSLPTGWWSARKLAIQAERADKKARAAQIAEERRAACGWPILPIMAPRPPRIPRPPRQRPDPALRKLRLAFAYQRKGAKARGIEFLFTFAEWLAFWEASGKLAERGQGGPKFCMARHGDVGPYSASNVSIKTNSENMREANAIRRAKAKATHKPAPEALTTGSGNA